MPIRDSRDKSVQFDKLGGLNERPALNATPAPDFSTLHALYQKRAGSLTRLEGTRTLARLPISVGVLGGNQLNDGTGNVVVQGDNGSEYLFTLNELFGRTEVDTLVYLPLPDDNNMPTAILIQDAANNTGLATIGGASANTWYQRPLTANPINESGIITTFAANQFTVAAGTYRIRGYVTLAGTLAVTGGSSGSSVIIGFRAAIKDTTTSTTVAIGSSELVEFQRSPVSGGYTFGPVNIKSFIDYTFTIAGPSASVLEVQNAYSQTLLGVGTSAITGGSPGGVTAVLDGAALTERYVCLNLAQIT